MYVFSILSFKRWTTRRSFPAPVFFFGLVQEILANFGGRQRLKRLGELFQATYTLRLMLVMFVVNVGNEQLPSHVCIFFLKHDGCGSPLTKTTKHHWFEFTCERNLMFSASEKSARVYHAPRS